MLWYPNNHLGPIYIYLKLLYIYILVLLKTVSSFGILIIILVSLMTILNVPLTSILNFCIFIYTGPLVEGFKLKYLNTHTGLLNDYFNLLYIHILVSLKSD